MPAGVKKSTKSEARSQSRRPVKKKEPKSEDDSRSPERYSMSPAGRRRPSTDSSERYSDRTRTRSRRSDSDNEDGTAPDKAPSWMKQLIDGIKTSNYRIEVMEQNFAQEVQMLQSSISNTDKNVQTLN
eukprot:9090797-Pyramimonas_sp.AAC.1